MKTSFYIMMIFASLFVAGVVYAAGPNLIAQRTAQPVYATQYAPMMAAPQVAAYGNRVYGGMMGTAAPVATHYASYGYGAESFGGFGHMLAHGFTMLLVWVLLILVIKILWHKLKRCKKCGACGMHHAGCCGKGSCCESDMASEAESVKENDEE